MVEKRFRLHDEHVLERPRLDLHADSSPRAGTGASRPCSTSRSAARFTASNGSARARRDVEQVVIAVGIVEDPEECHLGGLAVERAADHAIEPTATELRLALGVQVDEPAVALEHVHDVVDRLQRPGELRRLDEVEVVARRVVLGILAVHRATQPTDREVEARGTELALVVAVRGEVDDPRVVVRRAQHVLDGTVDVGVAAPALLVGEGSGVPDARDHQTVTDAPDVLLVASEPDDRADGAGYEQQPVRVAERSGAEQTPESREHRDPGEVVVRQ